MPIRSGPSGPVFFLAAMLLLLPLVAAEEEAILISSPGCTKCAAAERVLEGVLADFPEVEMVVYEVYSDEAREVIRERRVKGGVPALVMGDAVIGYKDYEGDEVLLEEMIREALASSRAGVEEGGAEGGTEAEDQGSIVLSPTAAFLAGFVAGFNPCLLAILAFLTAAVVSETGRRKDVFLMIVSFSLGIFFMYYLFGAGLLRTLQAEALEAGFKLGLSLILLALGLVHIEDARRLKNGSESLFRASWSHRYIEGAVSKGKLSSYFLLGALFSLVKAPCVGAVYIVILGLISDEGYGAGAVYLLLYNLGVVLPVVLLGSAIALGMNPERVDGFRKDHRAGIRLLTGLTLIALAPLIYWQAI